MSDTEDTLPIEKKEQETEEQKKSDRRRGIAKYSCDYFCRGRKDVTKNP